MIIMDASGTVVITHKPSTEPFAPWETQGEGESEGEATSNKVGEEDGAEEFKARCSSEILQLVSPMLRKTIGGCWKESEPDEEGIRHVTLVGFDSLALEYVLNILHHQTNLIPQYLDVEMLAKMAVIVEYLGCDQAFKFAGTAWQAKYPGLPEAGIDRSVVLWLFVSRVFAMSAIFDAVATRLIEDGLGQLNELGLPFAESAVSKCSRLIAFCVAPIYLATWADGWVLSEVVNEYREDKIRLLIQRLHGVKKRLLGGTGCTIECDSAHLGRLMIHMSRYKLDPFPCEPYDGISISEIRRMVGEVRQFSKPTGEGRLSQVHMACHAEQKPKDVNVCKLDGILKRILKKTEFEFESEANM